MVTYNKNGTVTKGNRKLYSGGPRDRQVKLASANQFKDWRHLKEELGDITTTMKTSDVGYSKEQVNNLINDSINDVSATLETKYIHQINSLEKELNSKDSVIENLTTTITKLESTLEKREEIIIELTDKVSQISSRPTYITQVPEEVEDPDRPSIDKVFIDPTVKGAEDNYESHVKTVEEASTKGSVTNDVDKLKSLMGNKLPKI